MQINLQVLWLLSGYIFTSNNRSNTDNSKSDNSDDNDILL